MEAAIELAGVTRRFGTLTALEGIDLRAEAGTVVAVVGPSGCGKSTLLELVCGLQAPDAGTVDAPPAALMPQHDGLLPWLSALDNAGLFSDLESVERRMDKIGKQVSELAVLEANIVRAWNAMARGTNRINESRGPRLRHDRAIAQRSATEVVLMT
jgi:ABC-type nitrate/sulfonate/bicarbonate transport system ATPase subunit